MDEIEYLEEYENLIKPGGENEATRTVEDDESSSSIDQDIFESLFDDQSDDESEELPKKVVQQVQQRLERESIDSLDMLVRDLGEPLYVKNEQNMPESSPSSSRVHSSLSKKPITPCLKKSTPDTMKNTKSFDGQSSSSTEKPQKRVMFANLPNVMWDAAPSSSKAVEQQNSYSISGRKSIESVKNAVDTSKCTDTNSQRKLNRPQLTIVRPEKIQFKDPVEDPLSLEKVESDYDEALSDISNDSFVSLSEIFVTASELNDVEDLSKNLETLETTADQKSNIIESTSTYISTANLPEKVKIISDTVLTRIEPALLESLTADNSKDLFAKNQSTLNVGLDTNNVQMAHPVAIHKPENCNQNTLVIGNKATEKVSVEKNIDISSPLTLAEITATLYEPLNKSATSEEVNGIFGEFPITESTVCNTRSSMSLENEKVDLGKADEESLLKANVHSNTADTSEIPSNTKQLKETANEDVRHLVGKKENISEPATLENSASTSIKESNVVSSQEIENASVSKIIKEIKEDKKNPTELEKTKPARESPPKPSQGETERSSKSAQKSTPKRLSTSESKDTQNLDQKNPKATTQKSTPKKSNTTESIGKEKPDQKVVKANTSKGQKPSASNPSRSHEKIKDDSKEDLKSNVAPETSLKKDDKPKEQKDENPSASHKNDHETKKETKTKNIVRESASKDKAKIKQESGTTSTKDIDKTKSQNHSDNKDSSSTPSSSNRNQSNLTHNTSISAKTTTKKVQDPGTRKQTLDTTRQNTNTKLSRENSNVSISSQSKHKNPANSNERQKATSTPQKTTPSSTPKKTETNQSSSKNTRDIQVKKKEEIKNSNTKKSEENSDKKESIKKDDVKSSHNQKTDKDVPKIKKEDNSSKSGSKEHGADKTTINTEKKISKTVSESKTGDDQKSEKPIGDKSPGKVFGEKAKTQLEKKISKTENNSKNDSSQSGEKSTFASSIGKNLEGKTKTQPDKHISKTNSDSKIDERRSSGKSNNNKSSSKNLDDKTKTQTEEIVTKTGSDAKTESASNFSGAKSSPAPTTSKRSDLEKPALKREISTSSNDSTSTKRIKLQPGSSEGNRNTNKTFESNLSGDRKTIESTTATNSTQHETNKKTNRTSELDSSKDPKTMESTTTTNLSQKGTPTLNKQNNQTIVSKSVEKMSKKSTSEISGTSSSAQSESLSEISIPSVDSTKKTRSESLNQRESGINNDDLPKLSKTPSKSSLSLKKTDIKPTMKNSPSNNKNNQSATLESKTPQSRSQKPVDKDNRHGKDIAKAPEKSEKVKETNKSGVEASPSSSNKDETNKIVQNLDSKSETSDKTIPLSKEDSICSENSIPKRGKDSINQKNPNAVQIATKNSNKKPIKKTIPNIPRVKQNFNNSIAKPQPSSNSESESNIEKESESKNLNISKEMEPTKQPIEETPTSVETVESKFSKASETPKKDENNLGIVDTNEVKNKKQRDAKDNEKEEVNEASLKKHMLTTEHKSISKTNQQIESAQKVPNIDVKRQRPLRKRGLDVSETTTEAITKVPKENEHTALTKTNIGKSTPVVNAVKEEQSKKEGIRKSRRGKDVEYTEKAIATVIKEKAIATTIKEKPIATAITEDQQTIEGKIEENISTTESKIKTTEPESETIKSSEKESTSRVPIQAEGPIEPSPKPAEAEMTTAIVQLESGNGNGNEQLDSLSMTSVESIAFSGFAESSLNTAGNEILKEPVQTNASTEADQQQTEIVSKDTDLSGQRSSSPSPKRSKTDELKPESSAVITFKEWLARKNNQKPSKDASSENENKIETETIETETETGNETKTSSNEKTLKTENEKEKFDGNTENIEIIADNKDQTDQNLEDIKTSPVDPKPYPKHTKPNLNRKSEIAMLKEAMPKEMRESGIEMIIESHFSAPHCLTKRSIAQAMNDSNTTITRRSASKQQNVTQTNRSSRASLANKAASINSRLRQSPVISAVGLIKISPNRTVAKTRQRNGKLLNIKQDSLTQMCRNFRIRLNRSIVRKFLENQLKTQASKMIITEVQTLQPTEQLIIPATPTTPAQDQSKGRKRKAPQQNESQTAKKVATTATMEKNVCSSSTVQDTATTVTRASRQNASNRTRTTAPLPKGPSTGTATRSLAANVTPTTQTEQAIPTIDDAALQKITTETNLLTPISEAPTITTPTESSRRGKSKRSIATATIASNTTKVTKACSSTIPSISPAPSHTSLQSKQCTPMPAPTQQVSINAGIAPKTERVDEYDTDYAQMTKQQALQTSQTTSSSLIGPAPLIHVSPPLSTESRANSAVSASTIPLVISGATSNSLPPLAIDNVGTRIYSFLHPTKYNNSHGFVMLDYCCPNLDGPMTAIDPTRRHAKVDVAVRELPAYITMETRLVTRAELEADSNALPASIRHKVQRITGGNKSLVSGFPGMTPNLTSANATSTTTVPPKATTASISATTTPTISTSMVSNEVPASVSALQKQLPSTTTLTPKTMPALASSAASAFKSSSGGNSNSGSREPTATIKPTSQAEMRVKLRNQLKNYDVLLKKHYPRISLLSFNQRQEIIENIANTTQLLPREIETATRLLQEYVTQMTLHTATTSQPTTSAISAPPTTSTAISAGTLRPVQTVQNMALKAALETPPITTRSQMKRSTAASSNLQRRSVPIFNSDKTVIGYQVQLVAQSGPNSNNSGNTTMPNSSNFAPTSTRRYNKNASTTQVPSTSSKTTTRRSGIFMINKTNMNAPTTPTMSVSNASSPRILYTAPDMQTQTPTLASMVHMPQASSTPLGMSPAGSIVTRSGATTSRLRGGSTMRQGLTRAATAKLQSPAVNSSPVPILSNSNSLPRLPTLTRNPHLPPIPGPLSQQQSTSITGRTDMEQSQYQKRLTRKTAAANVGAELLIINHDSQGNPLPATEESILPDSSSTVPADHIKCEKPDEF